LRGEKGGTFVVGPGRHLALLRYCPQLTVWSNPNAQGRTYGARDPRPSKFLAPHASVTYFIWPLVWKAWRYAPLMCSSPKKFYLLLCRLWFCNCVRSSTEIKAFPIFFWKTKGIAIFSWNL